MSETPARRGGRRVERLVAAVEALAPLVEAERARLDRDRLLPPRLVDALAAAGLFRLWAPRRLGGAELDPVAGLRVIAAVAALDGSVGWNVMVAAAHSFLAGRLPDRAARDVFGDRRAVVASQLEPGGAAARALVHARSAERLLREAVDDLWRTVRRGKPATLEQRAEVRMGGVNAGVASAAAVDLLWELAGAGAVFEDAGLERRFRDMHVATQHVALAPRTLEVAGRVVLGLDPRGIF